MRLRSISNAVMTLASAGSLVNASPAPHQHGHAHVDKRTVKIVDVPGPTVVAYELNGKFIDQSEVCEGIEAGTLKFADGTTTLPGCSGSAEPVSHPVLTSSLSIGPTPASTAASISSMTPTAPAMSGTVNDIAHEALEVSSTSVANSKVSSVPSPIASNAGHLQTQASNSPSSTSADGQGLNHEFPDGELDCATFPSEYGPINVEWAGLGGWSGIQYVSIQDDVVTHIDTAVPGGDGCKPGAMCSYACPAGYQKSQWPSQQGSTGQSVGGLSCDSNGKLALTNPGLSKYLCIRGTGAVTVQNELSSNAAICRTDYPGL